MSRFPIAAFAMSLRDERDRERFVMFSQRVPSDRLLAFIDQQRARAARGLPVHPHPIGRW